MKIKYLYYIMNSSKNYNMINLNNIINLNNSNNGKGRKK